MNCSGCGHENRDSAKFCEACAAPLARTCASCGTALRAGARFCDECAHPAGSSVATLAPALCEWRAELAAALGNDAERNERLREAQQGYEAIGAPTHAARLATELAA